MKSKAVIFTDQYKVEFGEVETPDPGPDDVVVRTTKSWISNGTEGAFLRMERWDGCTPWHPALPKPYPMVPGYQKVGVVESVGANVKGLQEGQRVFNTITSCKDVQFGFAGHIERGPTPANEVFPLPEGDDSEPYAGMVLTQVGYNSASRPPVTPETRAVVVGDGMVGQWASQTLQARGAKVCLVGGQDRRLALFNKRDGELTLNALADRDWFAKAQEWSGGAFEVIVDTVGNRRNEDVNYKFARNMKWGGHFVITGDAGPKSFMDLADFIRKEITIHCPCAWTRERLETVMQWIHEGKLRTAPLITHRFKAPEAALAWDKIFKEEATTLGVILEWD